MDNNNNILINILGILGVLFIMSILYKAYKALDNNTETNVITDDAIKVIQDPKNGVLLRKEIDNYHETGEWNTEKLETIL